MTQPHSKAETGYSNLVLLTRRTLVGQVIGCSLSLLLLAAMGAGTANPALGQGQTNPAPASQVTLQAQAQQTPKASSDKAAGGKNASANGNSKDAEPQNGAKKPDAARGGSKGTKDAKGASDQAGNKAGGQKKDAAGGGDAGGGNENLINADRPGIADGSQVIGPRRIQIEAGIEEDFLGGGKATQRLLTVPTLLRFGISNRYELRIESSGYANLSSTDPQNGTQHTDGASPISIGFKRQFQTSSGARHPGVGAIVRLFPGSGGGAFRSNHATYDVRAAADWDFAPHLSLNPNIGGGVYEDDQGRLYATGLLATTLTYAPNTRLGFFIDYGLQTRQTSSSAASLIYDGGVTYIVGSNIQLDVAVGTGALGQTTPHPFWTSGISVRF